MKKSYSAPFTNAELKQLEKVFSINVYDEDDRTDSWRYFIELIKSIYPQTTHLRLHEESDISCGINRITGVSRPASLVEQMMSVFYSAFCNLEEHDRNSGRLKEFGSQTLFSDRLRSKTCAEMKKAAIKIHSTNANSGNVIVLYVLTPSLATKFIKKSLKKLNKK